MSNTIVHVAVEVTANGDSPSGQNAQPLCLNSASNLNKNYGFIHNN